MQTDESLASVTCLDVEATIQKQIQKFDEQNKFLIQQNIEISRKLKILEDNLKHHVILKVN